MVNHGGKDTNYGSIFLLCFLCFVPLMGTVSSVKPFTKLKEKLMETEALVEEGFLGAKLPCNSQRPRPDSVVPADQKHDEKKLKAPAWIYRQLSPTSYCIKFDSFTSMSKQVKNGKYESRTFTVGGYNWSLIIYPNGNKQENVNGYISVYVRLHNASLMTRDVYAEVKFFLYNTIKDQYYTYQDNEPKRFHMFRQEFGYPNLFGITTLTTATNGFVFNGGQSVFGVDVFVAQPFNKWEVFSNVENIRDPIFSWTLTNYSTRDLNYYTSGWFHSGGRDWQMKLYPNGVGAATGNSLSLFLLSASQTTDYVQAKLKVLDQIKYTYFEKLVEGWPNATENGWGLDKFMPLADIRNATKGFIVNDTLKIEVEILSFSKTDYFSV